LEDGVENPHRDANEDDYKQRRAQHTAFFDLIHRPFRLPFIPTATPPSTAIPFLALLRQKQPILNPTTALQDPLIVRAFVALANHLRAAELELRRQVRGTAPLHVLGVVVAALVRAAHDVDFVVLAAGALAGELRDGGDAAVGGFLVGAEGEGLDL
jgi:hypothetical protein